MSLRRFFVYSIVVHALILLALIIYKPAVNGKKMGGALFTRLVSIDEFRAQKPYLPNLHHIRPSAQRSHIMPKPKQESQGTIFSEKGDIEDEIPSSRLSSHSASPSQQAIAQGEKSEQRVQKPGKSEHLLREKLFDRNIISNLAKREIEKEAEKEKKDKIPIFDTTEEKRDKSPIFDVKGDQTARFKDDSSKIAIDKSFNIDKTEFKYLLYNQRLKERIESIWVYPSEAASRGIYGDLFIRFTIKKNGRLGAVELIRTSGHTMLDNAAMKALRDGEPYWPLPESWGMEGYTINGHFVYTMYYIIQ